MSSCQPFGCKPNFDVVFSMEFYEIRYLNLIKGPTELKNRNTDGQQKKFGSVGRFCDFFYRVFRPFGIDMQFFFLIWQSI